MNVFCPIHTVQGPGRRAGRRVWALPGLPSRVQGPGAASLEAKGRGSQVISRPSADCVRVFQSDLSCHVGQSGKNVRDPTKACYISKTHYKSDIRVKCDCYNGIYVKSPFPAVSACNNRSTSC
jgi:hypothetical protein